jgi:hypothetical protein
MANYKWVYFLIIFLLHHINLQVMLIYFKIRFETIHDNGLTHRDVHSGNILFVESNHDPNFNGKLGI